jgi:hypothetical protein
MSDTPKLPDFDSFVFSLRQNNLPGTQNRRLLREMYGLAEEGRWIETEGLEKLKDMARQHREVIRKYDVALRALGRVELSLDIATKLAKEVSVDSRYWNSLFDPTKKSIQDGSDRLLQARQMHIDRIHNRFLKGKELHKYVPLSLWKEYEYPLKRFGWKPIETWFLGVLDDMLTATYGQGKKALTPGDRYRLIRLAFQTAFGQEKDLKTIAVAVARFRKARNNSS